MVTFGNILSVLGRGTLLPANSIDYQSVSVLCFRNRSYLGHNSQLSAFWRRKRVVSLA